jgi:hypothetical protein
MITLAISGIQRMRHISFDWIGAAILFFLATLLVALMLYTMTRPSRKATVVTSQQGDTISNDEDSFRDQLRLTVAQMSAKQDVKAGVWARDIFTDLEMDALQLYKDLEHFLDSFGPEPQPTEPTNSVEGLARYIDGPRSVWRNRILGAYAERFAPKVKSIANRMQMDSLPDDVLPHYFERLDDIPDIYRIQARMWVYVLRSKRIDLKGEL